MTNGKKKLRGLIAAPYTPMNPDLSVNLGILEAYADHLHATGATGAFICGSTGECHSLTTDERKQIAKGWSATKKNTDLKLVVHVGDNCLADAQELAGHAQSLEADAIAAMAPNYFKPQAIEDLIYFCGAIANRAPNTPFYLYHIPAMTGVNLSPAEFLDKGRATIPTLMGIKYSSLDLIQLQKCLRYDSGRFNLLFGCDEVLISALTLGVDGAVGSTFNYATELYLNIIKAHRKGDFELAQRLQHRSVQMVDCCLKFGLVAAGKAVMEMVGVDCGPVRPPLRCLSEAERNQIRHNLSKLGVVGERNLVTGRSV